MKWMVWLIVAIVVIAALLIYLLYPMKISAEQACIDSGGTVVNQLCCNSANDFPNTCLIGACGCSPDNSHNVKVCDCEEGKCWDSEKSQCV
jgi:hypothetical protein